MTSNYKAKQMTKKKKLESLWNAIKIVISNPMGSYWQSDNEIQYSLEYVGKYKLELAVNLWELS